MFSNTRMTKIAIFLVYLLCLSAVTTQASKAQVDLVDEEEFDSHVRPAMQRAMQGLEQHLRSLSPAERQALEDELQQDSGHKEMLAGLEADDLFPQASTSPWPFRPIQEGETWQGRFPKSFETQHIPHPDNTGNPGDEEVFLSSRAKLGVEGPEKSITGYDLTQTMEKFIANTRDSINDVVDKPLDMVAKWKRNNANANIVKRKVTQWLHDLVESPVNWTKNQIRSLFALLRSKLGLPTYGYWVLLHDPELTHFRLKPLKLEQTRPGRMELDVDASVAGGVHAGIYKVGRGQHKTLFKYNLRLDTPVRVVAKASAETGTSYKKYRMDTSVSVPEGLRALRTEHAEIMDKRLFEPIRQKMEAIYRKVEDATKAVADWAYNSKLVSWAGGVIERTMQAIARGMRKLADFIKELVDFGQYLADKLLAWAMEKEKQLRLWVIKTYAVPKVSETLNKTLVAGGEPVWSVLRQPFPKSHPIKAELTELSANKVFLTKGLAPKLLSLVMDPLVASASEVEEVKEKFRAEEARTGPIRTRDLCAARRCLKDSGKDKCHSADLISYKAFSKLIYRAPDKVQANTRRLCWEGKVLPTLLSKVTDNYDSYCCAVTVKEGQEPHVDVSSGRCNIETCLRHSIPKEAAPVRNIEVTTNAALFTKRTDAVETWNEVPATPLTAEGISSCNFAQPKWEDSLALWAGKERQIEITHIRIASSRHGEACPRGFETISKTYLNEESANLLLNTPMPARSTDTDPGDMFLCIMRGGRRRSPITAITLVEKGKSPPPHFTALTHTISRKDASFTPLKGCKPVYLAVRRLSSYGLPTLHQDQSSAELLELHRRDPENQVLLSDSDLDNLVATPSRDDAMDVDLAGDDHDNDDASQEEAAAAYLAATTGGAAGDVLTSAAFLPPAGLIGDTMWKAIQLARRQKLETSSYTGFGMAFSPPPPKEFPFMGIKVWLQDLQPMSFLYLKHMTLDYADNIVYNELGATKENPRTMWGGCITDDNRPGECKTQQECNGIGSLVPNFCPDAPSRVRCCVADRLPNREYSGPGFRFSLDLHVAAQAKIVVLGTPLFGGEITLGEVMALFIPRDMSVTAAKYPGGRPEDVLFSSTGPARMSFHVQTGGAIWYDGNLKEWRLRVSELKIKELDVALSPKQKPFRWVVEKTVDTGVDIAKQLLDLTGLEIAFGKQNARLAEFGQILHAMKGQGAQLHGGLSMSIPPRLMGSDVLKPMYAVLREQLLKYGIQTNN
eukprot:TRINITY_DN3590_c0_g1_i1.p1 TRINITY_DN3590_c0_g1~~TRINITY_DN3590_c0_g1_i1.p1  ORF type:complete len:1241 (-),score=360.39 TRINITY_DN3590_c0_g1_i1:202-3924(-)